MVLRNVCIRHIPATLTAPGSFPRPAAGASCGHGGMDGASGALVEVSPDEETR